MVLLLQTDTLPQLREPTRCIPHLYTETTVIFTIERGDTMIAAMDVTTTAMIMIGEGDPTMTAIRGDGEEVIPVQEDHEGIITMILTTIPTMVAATAITMTATATTMIDTLQGIAAAITM
jgi:hypothetical protein